MRAILLLAFLSFCNVGQSMYITLWNYTGQTVHFSIHCKESGCLSCGGADVAVGNGASTVANITTVGHTWTYDLKCPQGASWQCNVGPSLYVDGTTPDTTWTCGDCSANPATVYTWSGCFTNNTGYSIPVWTHFVGYGWAGPGDGACTDLPGNSGANDGSNVKCVTVTSFTGPFYGQWVSGSGTCANKVEPVSYYEPSNAGTNTTVNDNGNLNWGGPGTGGSQNGLGGQAGSNSVTAADISALAGVIAAGDANIVSAINAESSLLHGDLGGIKTDLDAMKVDEDAIKIADQSTAAGVYSMSNSVLQSATSLAGMSNVIGKELGTQIGSSNLLWSTTNILGGSSNVLYGMSTNILGTASNLGYAMSFQGFSNALATAAGVYTNLLHFGDASNVFMSYGNASGTNYNLSFGSGLPVSSYSGASSMLSVQAFVGSSAFSLLPDNLLCSGFSSFVRLVMGLCAVLWFSRRQLELVHSTIHGAASAQTGGVPDLEINVLGTGLNLVGVLVYGLVITVSIGAFWYVNSLVWQGAGASMGGLATQWTGVASAVDALTRGGVGIGPLVWYFLDTFFPVGLITSLIVNDLVLHLGGAQALFVFAGIQRVLPGR